MGALEDTKFRAWLIDEKRMVEWTPEFFSDMSVITGYSSTFPYDDAELILLRYTGLKDKNGHGDDIYDSHLIRRPDGQVYAVVWRRVHGQWWLRGWTKDNLLGAWFTPLMKLAGEGMVICGSIHEARNC